MRVVIAVAGVSGRALAAEFDELGDDVRAVVAAAAPAAAVADAMAGPEAAELLAELARADLLVVTAERSALTAGLVAACDRFGVRIAPLCDSDVHRRAAAAFGLPAADPAAGARGLRAAPAPVEATRSGGGRVLTVWGAEGAPGRTAIAIELAIELARDGRRVGLVDADTVAPSIALATGLPDEAPGFAAACRQAERGALTIAELDRISAATGAVDVLTGINRPGRWPELSGDRVAAALETCRTWVDDTVVDIASCLEKDEEIVSDLDGPRRNAAAIAALTAADVVVAVVAADPVGVSRFVRAYPEMRALAGPTPVRVVVNKMRPGALGFDARAQVRRALERYAGIDDVWFVPFDARALDAALLAARPVAQTAPRSAFSAGVRRFVGEAIEPPAPTVPATRGHRDRVRGRRRRRDLGAAA